MSSGSSCTRTADDRNFIFFYTKFSPFLKCVLIKIVGGTNGASNKKNGKGLMYRYISQAEAHLE
jgi:hypothetical protein